MADEEKIVDFDFDPRLFADASEGDQDDELGNLEEEGEDEGDDGDSTLDPLDALGGDEEEGASEGDEDEEDEDDSNSNSDSSIQALLQGQQALLSQLNTPKPEPKEEAPKELSEQEKQAALVKRVSSGLRFYPTPEMLAGLQDEDPAKASNALTALIERAMQTSAFYTMQEMQRDTTSTLDTRLQKLQKDMQTQSAAEAQAREVQATFNSSYTHWNAIAEKVPASKIALTQAAQFVQANPVPGETLAGSLKRINDTAAGLIGTTPEKLATFGKKATGAKTRKKSPTRTTPLKGTSRKGKTGKTRSNSPFSAGEFANL